MAPMNDRESLQTLRGLACLLLVAYHVVGADPSSGLRLAEGPVRQLNDGLAYLRMPLFTVLSGLVYGLRPFAGDSRAFLAGKARRLLVPMLVVGTLFALAQSFVQGTNFASAPGAGRNWLLLHLEPVGHFWFLEALFWIFLLVWALERREALGTPRKFAIAWLAAVAAHLTLRAPSLLGLSGALYLLPYFLARLAISRFHLRARLGGAGIRVALAAAAIVAIVVLGAPVPNPDRQTLGILVAGLSLCGLCIGLRVRVRWLARVGGASYAIYLFHVFFTAPTRIALEMAGVDLIAVHLVAGIAAGLGAPMLLEHWAKGKPGIRLALLGQSWRGPRPAAGAAAAGA
jgi:peptidoglycan/LPS O-acetylase OafA/YrhL